MRHDPLERLTGVCPGVRLSLRLATEDGLSDLIGLLLELGAEELVLEDRRGVRHTVPQDRIVHARQIPTVPRGRNPEAFAASGLYALAEDPWLAGAGQCWVARLADLVDHLDDSQVTPVSAERAERGGSRGMVNGEWAAVRLATTADLLPLAAWAARRDARNVVLTSDLPAAELTGLGLRPLPR